MYILPDYYSEHVQEKMIPFWGVATFSEQTSLLKNIVGQEVRQVVRNLWALFFEKVNTPQCNKSMDGRESEKSVEYTANQPTIEWFLQ